MHGKVVHFITYMFVFSCQICKFAFPLYRARSCITVILRADFDATVRLREVIALESQENRKQNKLNCCSEQLYGVLDCRCLACVQTSPASSGKNRERRRFFLDGGGDVCTQTNRCLSWQWGMKGTTQASGADSTSAGTCWHNVYKQDSSTWLGNPTGFLILWTLTIPVCNR